MDIYSRPIFPIHVIVIKQRMERHAPYRSRIKTEFRRKVAQTQKTTSSWDCSVLLGWWTPLVDPLGFREVEQSLDGRSCRDSISLRMHRVCRLHLHCPDLVPEVMPGRILLDEQLERSFYRDRTEPPSTTREQEEKTKRRESTAHREAWGMINTIKGVDCAGHQSGMVLLVIFIRVCSVDYPWSDGLYHAYYTLNRYYHIYYHRL